jgi:hypothetical protein
MLAALFIYLYRRRYPLSSILYIEFNISSHSLIQFSPSSMPEEMEGDGDALTFRTLLASLNLLAPKNPGKKKKRFEIFNFFSEAGFVYCLQGLRAVR